MNASTYRDTQFELLVYRQGPNSFFVSAAERGAHGEPAVDLDLEETRFTVDELTAIHSAQRILETKFAEKFAEHQTKPEDLKQVINEAAQAKKDLEASTLARAQLEAETIARRADLDAELEAKRKEAEQLAADLASMRAAVEAQKTTSEETTKRE